MGTNYYWRSKCCLMCERYDEHHIGKRSKGWEFIFRGWNDDKFTVQSWSQWKELILSGGGIYDEYGEEFMPHEFIKIVEDTRVPEARNHFDYCLEKCYMQSDPAGSKDADGWSLTYGEFC